MRQSWPSLVTLAISVVAGAVVVAWGGQDKLGQFRVELLWAEPWLLLFFPGPYLVLALSALVTWGHRTLSISALLATALLTAVHILVLWSDHAAYLQTPPGEEVIPMLSVLATILVWLGALIVLMAVGIRRVLNRRRTAEGEPAPLA